MGQVRTVYRVLVRNPEWKKLLERRSLSWEDNITIIINRIRCGQDLSGSRYDPVAAFVSMVMNHLVP
jgi:hypothetical protein